MIGDDGRDIICPWSMKVLYDADFTGYESQKKLFYLYRKLILGIPQWIQCH
jgi:hypothetical protein